MRKLHFSKSSILLILAMVTAGGIVYWRLSRETVAAERVLMEAKENLAPKRNADSSAPPPVAAASPESDAIAVIRDRNVEGSKRLEAVSQLSSHLTAEEISTLIDFIKTSANSDFEYVLKNNLMNKFRDQQLLTPNLSTELLSIAGDKNQNIVVRVYALQHLRPQYELTKDGAIRDYLYQALGEQDNEIAGGALLALHYLAREYPNEFDRAPIAETAIRIALDQGANSNNRISAIQIASADTTPAYTAALREIIADPGSRQPLLISAIAGLGEAGDSSDLAVLEPIASSNRFEKKAALTAIYKIKNR